MNDKLLNFLGLCRRAGKLVCGNEIVLEEIKSGRAEIVMLASDLSQNSRKTVLKTAGEFGVKVYEIKRTKDEIESAIGKYAAILSVSDKGFAGKFLKITSGKSNELELEECTYDDKI